jgi:hypothetical protein
MASAVENITNTERIIMLERGALDRWGKGDPGGFLDLYSTGITYFDPLTATRIDGHQEMVNYYRPWVGKIKITRYEMLNPQVVVEGGIQDAEGVETVASRWNSTTVYQQRSGEWKTIHSHWSFTRHFAFQNMSAEESERQGE